MSEQKTGLRNSDDHRVEIFTKDEKCPICGCPHHVDVKEIIRREDEIYPQVLAYVRKARQTSPSGIMKRFIDISYSGACRMMEKLEKEGWLSPKDGIKPRKVLKARDIKTCDEAP